MRLAFFLALVLAAPTGVSAQAASDTPRVIERVKSSIVAVGTFQRTRAPQFRFLGTGFAVGDGATIVTNAHVLPTKLDSEHLETIAIAVPMPKRQVQVRPTTRGAADPAHDLALLRIQGAPLPALAVRDSDGVREGELVLFTGFPIGNVLGPFPATHRGMVAAITPIAIPPAHASQLDQRAIRQLASGAFPVFQLDATAYPGNSGSPVYAADTGEVIGVVNMVFVKGTKEAALTQPSGITYAIPSRHLVELMKRGGQ
ncbi:MAG TPA: serine protease [Burkholderiales bacterium]|nr:serine protease [Burkholderiales bacterium]